MSEVSLYEMGRVDVPVTIRGQRILQGYLAHKKSPPPPQDHPRPLGMRLLEGPRGRRFRMSEEPLYELDANWSPVPFLPVAFPPLLSGRGLKSQTRNPSPRCSSSLLLSSQELSDTQSL